MPLATMGIGLGTAIAGAVGGGSAIASGVIQSKAAGNAARQQTQAANYAAQQQAEASRRAEQFQREQAQAAWKAAETDRKANYDQWAARERRLGSVGSMLGLGPRDIPAYVPSPDPRLGPPAPPSVGTQLSPWTMDRRPTNGPVTLSQGPQDPRVMTAGAMLAQRRR